ncbi:MAG: molybdate ABC transporter substrate-binding protein, partial [Gemmatimonadales bacterium]
MRLLASSPGHLALAASLVTALSASRPTTAVDGALTVFAAASLTEAFKELGRRFEGSHPGIEVRFNFAGSQQLALQLELGARADVFASADTRWMTSVSDSGLVAGEAQVFAHNRLVVIVPAGNPARIDRLQEVARPGTKVVLAADAVPAGHYTRAALQNLAETPGLGAD